MKPPRTFVLDRHHDVSGVSGTGVVAEGVVFSDGSAALRWPGRYATTTTFEDGIEAIQAIHGHSGATEVRYLDLPDRQLGFNNRDYPFSTGLRVPTASVNGLCGGCLAAWPCTRCARPESH
ncbi:hypothetical protein [Kribbella deserti]|uniref:Uncharacterized protein n=1 Tax=Kribbella deserti TaxID=1926257 RepID=A0ABV6QU07_9ACTN